MDDRRREIGPETLFAEPGKETAPLEVAGGRGAKVQEIKKVAEKAEVPFYRDPDLAKTLHGLGIGVEIPPRLYDAIAVVLLFVAGLDKKNKVER